ncbi:MULTISPECIES: CPCC family cysteine-rich protein [unclassified Ruegeria]|uniref:CPCC family cysteine-rich protein n=1 Tax=unclassified Ruegeria TaxID=2625375 RepID=UPI0014887C75|nr:MULTISPECIES: CPCC family cysteine-rich protein [unclassified Ruegeria]
METDQKICACCRLPTLSERGNYEICMVCWWEDNGQDDHNADEVQGGPNQLYSLSEVRENYAHHGHMYANGEGIPELENPTEARRELLAYIGTKTDPCQKIDLEKFEFLLDRASKPTNR